jgi:hypothetical protein
VQPEVSRPLGSHEDLYSPLDQLGRELRQPVELSFGPAVLDGDVCSLRVAELPESIQERFTQGPAVVVEPGER